MGSIAIAGGGGSSQIVTGNTILYVATTGSDSNPGTLAQPFLTIQHGVNVLSNQITLEGGFCVLNVGAGTFVGAQIPYCTGSGALQIYGAGSGSTFITANGFTGDCFNLPQAFSPVFGVNSLTMQASGASACINIQAPVFVALGDFVNILGQRTDLIFDLTSGNFNFAILAGASGATISGSFGTTTALVKFANGSHENPFFLQIATTMVDQLHWTVSVASAGTATVNQWMRCDGECAYISIAGHASWTVTSGTITGLCYVGFGGGAAFSQLGPGSLGPNFFPGSGTFEVDSASDYDQFPFAQQSSVLLPTALNASQGWALFKDLTNGPRALFMNDGGTLYCKQLGRFVNAQTGTTYTMAFFDQDGRVEMNNVNPNTFTVPQDSAFSPVAPGVGAECRVVQTGAGATTIAAGVGATVNNAGAVGGQWKSALVYKTSANTWNQTSV